ncbi:hypothetical protein CEXT_634421, partial [Caerostris extrusa]
MGSRSNNNELTTYVYCLDPVEDGPIYPLSSLIVP